MTVEYRDRHPIAPDIPDPDRFVNRGSGNNSIIIFVPITGQYFHVMGGEDHGGSRLTDVPDAGSAVTRGRGKDVSMAGVPDCRIDAVCMFLEGADTGGAVNSPELDSVVPGGGEEGIAADRVPVNGMYLTGVLLEGTDRIGRGR